MFLVALVVGVALLISFMCSLMEAALLTVSLPYIKHLADRGSRSGKVLLQFKSHIGRPIAAILILNTVSHTVGASVAGALVADYGDHAVVVFSLVFTVLVLYLSEIVPKQLGTSYARQTAEFIALPLLVLTRVLHPIIWATEVVSKRLSGSDEEPSVSEHEVLSMAKLGREEGVLDHLEGSVIRNVVGLDRLLVKDVLTPRIVVFRLEETTALREIREEIMEWSYTRVPIFPSSNPDSITRYVIQRDLFRALVKGETEIQLKDLSRPLSTVSEFMRADKLLLQMFESRESICSVVDEHGAFAGIVTLEDIIEEIVGREIVDEYDLVSDLRSYAQILYHKKRRQTPHE
ncbi:MAG: HlyC/CorC family transporter [Bdellovibrionales bacterium]|nr:HlyC/CorC family transporter [Bdellovibrionales bacterium]